MSMICLLCGENETPDSTHDRICDRCYENAGEYLEQNIHLISAAPDLLDALEYLLEETLMLDLAVGNELVDKQATAWEMTTTALDKARGSKTAPSELEA